MATGAVRYNGFVANHQSCASDPCPPSLENHFGIPIQDEKQPLNNHDSQMVVVWTNDHLVVKPYNPPADDSELIKACTKTYNSNFLAIANLSPAASTLMNQGAAVALLARLEPKDIANFSEVSKCFFLATKKGYNLQIKEDAIWDVQLAKLLPNVKKIPSELCTFSPEQQFKIVYKRINDERKCFVTKLKRNEETCKNLKQMIQQTSKQFEEALTTAGGRDCKKRIIEERKLYSVADMKVLNLHMQCKSYQSQLFAISGEMEENGVVRHLGTGSMQSRLLNAIKILVPTAFDNQNKFNETIQKSESIKNTTSSNNSVAMEDVAEESDLQGHRGKARQDHQSAAPEDAGDAAAARPRRGGGGP